jgi:hypothetical protein
VNEASSHAASGGYRVSGELEREARGLFGKQPDAIQAHLVVDAGEQITAKDDGSLTHNTWIASYALARATTLLAWAFGEIQHLELEAIGQEPLFDEDSD